MEHDLLSRRHQNIFIQECMSVIITNFPSKYYSASTDSFPSATSTAPFPDCIPKCGNINIGFLQTAFIVDWEILS